MYQIIGNTITDNEVMAGTSQELMGGGIYCEGGSPVIKANVITGNSVDCPSASDQSELEGGAIMCNGLTEVNGYQLENGMSNVIIEANDIRQNYASGHGGGIALHDISSIRIVNNLFVGNHTAGGGTSTLGGGAIHSRYSAPTIVNNTFVQNWVGIGTWPDITPVAYGGAIHVRNNPSSPAVIVNNIFYDNRATTGQSVACTVSGVAHISYCAAPPGGQAPNYYADQSSNCGLGARLIYFDPVFYNAAQSEFWLDSSSALRLDTNRGQSHAVNSAVPTVDKNGHARSGALYTDMGAYESAYYSAE